MALPSHYKPSRLISPLKARQLQRALKNVKLTMLCGLLTILVLRGALGAGKFGTPAKDFEDLKHQFERVQSLHRRKQASRVLAEIIEERRRPEDAIAIQAQHVISYGVSEAVKVQNNGDVQSNGDLRGNPATHNYDDLDVKPTSDFSNHDSALSVKVSDQNARRHIWPLRRKSNPAGIKPPTMLVTGYRPSACGNPSGDHYLLKLIKNKVQYCNLHGIKILHNSAILDAEMAGFPAQFRLLRKLMLTHPEVEWFWWMGSDAMFSDMTLELNMEKYRDYHLVLHGWNEMIHDQQKGWVGLTTGSFLIRNSQWALTVLDEAGKLMDEGAGGVRDLPSVMHLIMNDQKINQEGILLSDQGLVYLHGFWKEMVNQSAEEDDDAGKDRDNGKLASRPFLTRFPGCKICRKGGDVGDGNMIDRCVEEMEQAFDAADGQILKFSGRPIEPASSTALRRLRGRSREADAAVRHRHGAVSSLPHQGAIYVSRAAST